MSKKNGGLLPLIAFLFFFVICVPLFVQTTSSTQYDGFYTEKPNIFERWYHGAYTLLKNEPYRSVEIIEPRKTKASQGATVYFVANLSFTDRRKCSIIGSDVIWIFGDGLHGEGLQVSHQFNAPGKYTVTATATFEYLCVLGPSTVNPPEGWTVEEAVKDSEISVSVYTATDELTITIVSEDVPPGPSPPPTPIPPPPTPEPTPDPFTNYWQLTVQTTGTNGDIFINGQYTRNGSYTASLKEGLYSISFGPVDSFATPEPRTVMLDEDLIVIGEYSQLYTSGILTIGTTPVSGDIFVNGLFESTGNYTSRVAPGSYSISFGDVSGYITPAPKTVNISIGESVYVEGIYQKISSGLEFPTAIIYQPSNEQHFHVNTFITFHGDGDAPSGIAQYLWQFGDGFTSNLNLTTHAFSRTGTYTITFKVFDNEGRWSPAATIKIVIVPPDHDIIASKPTAPTGLKGVGGDGQVSLEWTANPEMDILQYNIYKRLPGGPFTKIGQSATTHYVDTLVTNNVEYTYYVTAVSSTLGESPPSCNVGVTPVAKLVDEGPVAIIKTPVPNGNYVIGVPVQFSGHGSPDPHDIIAWYWNFGDGLHNVEESPTHIFNSSGEHTCSLRVQNSEGFWSPPAHQTFFVSSTKSSALKRDLSKKDFLWYFLIAVGIIAVIFVLRRNKKVRRWLK